jgi:molybdenum cofactor cytidylyltransferase
VIAGIVLAAGRSSRLGRPKQLLPVQGEPLLRFTLQRILTTSLDVVYVVLGHRAEEIAGFISDLPVQIVDNPDAEQGQSTSVLAGLRAVRPIDPDAVIFLLGDQPLVDPAAVNGLIARWQETRTGVVAPRYTGGPSRNPILFDRVVLPELMTLSGDVGARAIVRAHQQRGDISLVDVNSPAPRDVDTEADYAALLASLASATNQRVAVPCIDWCSEPE